ncbi:MAG: porin family protein [Blastocatellia bacterium]|nr:porin family protein [Blastocatellia bacterium]
MQKKFFIALALAALFVAFDSRDALAQSDGPKVDLGAQFSVIRFRDFDTTDAGFGGRIGYHFNDYISVEAEFNYFPDDKDGFFEGGRKTQGLFGIKTGVRSEAAGIYGKIRPGFVRFSRDFDTFEDAKTDFALDVGGVLELYPSESSVVRFDLGDTIIRVGERLSPFGPTASFTSHNFQFSIGVGFRF